MDWIWIVGMECWARVGVDETERRYPQRLKVEVGLAKDLERAGRLDRLEETIDYSAVVDEIDRWVESKPFRLVEAVAEGIADRLLKRFGPLAVCVRIGKFSIPGVEEAVVEINRTRTLDGRTSHKRSGSPKIGRRRSGNPTVGPARR
jgi:dihydroneopterin aldolase